VKRRIFEMRIMEVARIWTSILSRLKLTTTQISALSIDSPNVGLGSIPEVANNNSDVR
jgi:hypothetical protein